MKLYLTAAPSLEVVRYLRCINGADGIGGATMRKRALRDAISTVKKMEELDVTAQSWLSHVGNPVHAFVGDAAKETKTKRLYTHVLSGQVPHGACLDLGYDVCICSPCFAFMLLANQLDLLGLILVGMELCGTYSYWCTEADYVKRSFLHEPREARGCVFELPMATNVSRMRAFAERLKGFRGAPGARAALRWVVDGSASPMETAVYLLLCLPKRLGGYGLPKPVLNPKLIIDNPDGKKERYPDLFWRGRNIDVEYNSDAEHSGEWSRYRDSKREVELTVANIKVLPLTRPQLMDVYEFDAFANGLRRMLGIRARGADPAWISRRNELHRALLRSWL